MLKVCAGVKNHYINNYLKLTVMSNFMQVLHLSVCLRNYMKKSARLFANCGRGPKLHQQKLNGNVDSVPNRMGPSKKLHDFDQFLLMLMKIRLNMPMRDLADRFNIILCSSLFTSWSKAAAMVLGSVVFMPDGRINETKPRRFFAVKNLNCIIDNYIPISRQALKKQHPSTS